MLTKAFVLCKVNFWELLFKSAGFSIPLIWAAIVEAHIKMFLIHRPWYRSSLGSFPRHLQLSYHFKFMSRILFTSESFQLETGQLLCRTFTPTDPPLPKSRCFHRGDQRSGSASTHSRDVQYSNTWRKLFFTHTCTYSTPCHKSGGSESLRHEWGQINVGPVQLCTLLKLWSSEPVQSSSSSTQPVSG